MLTQTEKIIINLASSPKEWNKAHELIGNGDTFIGYEVSARLTDAENLYSEMIESKKDGKYKLRRLRIETSKEWLPNLPVELRKRVEGALQKAGKHYKKIVTRYVETPERTVREVKEVIEL